MRVNRLLLLLGVLAFLNMLFFWNSSFIATVIFIALAYLKHKLFPLQKEFILWLCIVIFGSMVEIFFVNVLGAWTYAKPDLFGIPLFMPFLWAFVGTTLVSFCLEFNTKH